MNLLGKILVWVVVVGAGAATALMARSVEIRNSWSNQIAKVRDENHKLAEEIARKQQQVADLDAEFERINLGWEGVWSPRPGGVADRQQGTLMAGVGRNDGFGVPERPTKPFLYAFQPVDQAGNYRYVGEFQLTSTLLENRSAVAPTWNLRAGEIDTWQASNGWRFRRSVPSGYRTRFQILNTQLQHAEENLARRQGEFTKQDTLAKAADAQLAFRVAEIIGGPMQPGLVKKIEEVEEQRNSALASVDSLRRQIHEARQTLDQLIRGNANLAKSLANPRPNANAAASGSTAQPVKGTPSPAKAN